MHTCRKRPLGAGLSIELTTVAYDEVWRNILSHPQQVTVNVSCTGDFFDIYTSNI